MCEASKAKEAIAQIIENEGGGEAKEPFEGDTELNTLFVEEDQRVIKVTEEEKCARLVVRNVNILIDEKTHSNVILNHLLKSKVERLKNTMVISKFIMIWPPLDWIKKCTTSIGRGLIL